ncbi:hypothetical protein MUN81_10530 [Hymenobacter sp. 5317J-9]|uniref:hypothetical protein n=1 Tax=Hymenobacter sp. 5317J-9 TaxID=2932250 RepID=UPI001FD68326|nr:hypothetical protein [Hymenobacter sp. 5317J-9]UOQ99915.1 hypothetical protein MUN81_10530 [Hymenobacter sp. 5317J-9]
MSEPISPRQLALDWLDITVERFVANMRRLQIENTGHLLASFKKNVIGEAGADRLRIQLSYALYGKFVDMGVGRGHGAGIRKGDDGYDRLRNSRGQLRRLARKARPWYSKEVAHQTKRLSELMLDLYGQVLVAKTVDALPGETTISF